MGNADKLNKEKDNRWTPQIIFLGNYIPDFKKQLLKLEQKRKKRGEEKQEETEIYPKKSLLAQGFSVDKLGTKSVFFSVSAFVPQ